MHVTEDSDRVEEWQLPWCGGTKLISLWDMKEYFTPGLVNATGFLGTAHVIVGFAKGGEENEFSKKDRDEVAECVARFLKESEFLGLAITAKAATRLVGAVKSESVEEVGKLLDEIHSRFSDEAANLPLFYVHQEALRYYNKTDLFGEQFKKNFPRSNSEIIEAGNCFAFDRFTASVSHLSRAMEIVLRVLFVSLGMPPRIWSTTKWSKILDRIKSKIDKNNKTLANDQKWNEERPFYENAHAFLAAVRVPIRNSTMHVESVYDESGAENVFGAVKSFMRHLATKLKETP
jgi:hypothetical protein